MKHLLYLLIPFGLYSCGSAMSAAVDKDQLSDVAVIDVPGKSKDEIFVEANTWVAQMFKDAKSVIDYSDKEAGRIVGKYTFEFLEGIYEYTGKTTVTIDIKDEKIRIEFSDPLFLYRGTLGSPTINNNWSPVRNKIIGSYHEQWNDMKTSLASALNTSATDW